MCMKVIDNTPDNIYYRNTHGNLFIGRTQNNEINS